MKLRSQIDDKYKWDLSEYFASEEDWEKLFEKTKNYYKKLLKYENNLNNKENIYSCLCEESKLGADMELLSVYANLKLKEDSFNSKAQARLDRLEKLFVQIDSELTFISVELKMLDDKFLLELASDKKFKDYDLMFKDIIKDKKHMLSKQEEILLSKTSEFAGQFSDIFDKFDTADVKFDDIKDSNGKTYKMNNSVYAVYGESTDRTLRKNAYKSMNGGYGKLNQTLAMIYMGSVKTDCFYSKIRKFNSSLDASLYGEDVDKSVYDALIEGVNNNLKIFHSYFDLKRKLLGLKKIAVYDMRAGTLKSTKKFTYEQAYNIVEDSVKVLGEDYKNVLSSAKTSGWIDVYANKGKDTGAFSWGAYKKHPVVLLNFEGTMTDVFTLGHELGHSMHTYYSNKNQVRQKAGYEIFVAEVASTVNEMLILLNLLHSAKTKKEKIYYYDYLFKMFYSTIFRQTLFAEFEEHVHFAYEKGEDTTAKALCDYYFELNKKYFGKNVELVDETKYEWSRIPHFYTAFYVYKYATGLISAFYIASKIFDGDKNVLKGYREFLTLGSTKPPVELLKVAGVDLSKKQTFDNAFASMQILLDEWKKLI